MSCGGISAAEVLLARLNNVIRTGPYNFRADCPNGHKSKRALAIKVEDDRVLIFCHALCPTADVMAALGLTLSDLYDTPLGHHYAPQRPIANRRIDYKAVYETVRTAAWILVVASSDVARGERLSDEDSLTLRRVLVALEKIGNIT